MKYRIIHKGFGKTLLSVIFSSFVAALAVAQTTPFKHVIIVVQENRTPDNLFNQSQYVNANGAHVQPSFPPPAATNSGLCVPTGQSTQYYIAMQPTDLYTCWDPDHSRGTRANPGAWVSTWHGGKMDGACNVSIFYSQCSASCITNGPNNSASCPYSYVQNSVWNPIAPYDRILNPYFQIAETYGFANFMFQTSQGPSFEAHQFLFSGTSVPVYYQDSTGWGCAQNQDCWEYFAAENSGKKYNGCVADAGTHVYLIDTNGDESYDWFNPQGYGDSYPCYDHGTLTDLLENANPPIDWKYYDRSVGDLWTAPNAIHHICDTIGQSQCLSDSDFAKHVVPPNGQDAAPILTDIEKCALAPVSWVIPDGNWSDHSNYFNVPVGVGDGGPSWVAAIVNAVGSAKSCDITGYWNDTVILVTWDDWGGYYDDVAPPYCNSNYCGYYNGGGNGAYYVYGFRVPLLVISAYSVSPGYISGAYVDPATLNCQNQNYCHDFGSILNFIEYVFGLPLGGIGSQYWPYADYYAPDTFPNGGGTAPYGLYDFFPHPNWGQPNQFAQINGAKYPEQCFHTPDTDGCFKGTYPLDPDNDANE